MKSKLLTILLLCFTTIVCSQTFRDERTTNLKKKKDLWETVKKEDSLNTIEINQYLLKNKQAKQVFKDKNGKTYVLYKIIEGKPIYRTTHNSTAAIATNTNELQIGGSLNLNLDGTGMTVWIWDGGPIQETHQEFQNSDNTGSRIINMENTVVDGDTGGKSNHANHVSGTIGAKGIQANAKGMAPNVSIQTYNFNNDAVEMVSVLNNPSSEMILSNHSYGIPIDQDGSTLDASQIGSYGSVAKQIDDISTTHPYYLMVSSAGNDGLTSYSGGLYGNYDKLTGFSTSKNNLVVANANPQISPFTNEIVALSINPSSSQGPTDDLRIKPDITGDGSGVYSPISNDGYDIFSGTSMSSPNVTGSLVLLQQYYNQLHNDYMKSSTLKGLVLHTARDDNDNPGPDPIFGWGLLDAEKAANTITNAVNGSAKIEELSLNNGDTYSFDFNVVSNDKIVATICWTDVSGSPVVNSTPNDLTPKLMNDLDIRITSEGTSYFPWKLEYSPSTGFSNSHGDNIVDNIEKIEIISPPAGTYNLTVSHKGTLSANEPFGPRIQNFSLILTGSFNTLTTSNFNENKLSVYPNPVNSVLNISSKQVIERIELYNALGSKLLTSKSVTNIDFSSFKSGIYFLKLFSNKSVQTKKIIKR
ncbi:S8 family serine peptidase [Yeosuana sp. AK3]